MMKNKNTLHNALLATLILSIGVFAYLTFHHYAVKTGAEGGGLCQVSATLNCDAAASSSYAEIGSIPIALVGLVFSTFLTLFVGSLRVGFVESSNYVYSLLITLFGGSVVVSIFLGFITFTQLKAVCPFCLAGYILSFAQFGLIWALAKDPGFKFSLGEFSANLGMTTTFLLIPIISWVISKNLSKSYNLEQIQTLVAEKTEIWKRAQEFTFDTTLGLIHGTPNAKATIVEFADFKCPHCKTAWATLKRFKAQMPDAAVIYKPFPLDGQCNPEMQQKGDKSRCTMAAWVLCTEKISKKGWLVHDYLFDHQERLFPLYGDELDKDLKTFATNNGLNYEEISMCANSSDMAIQIGKMVSEAKTAQVQGTPTIYLNNRKLEGAQIFDVLKNAYGTLN